MVSTKCLCLKEARVQAKNKFSTIQQCEPVGKHVQRVGSCSISQWYLYRFQQLANYYRSLKIMPPMITSDGLDGDTLNMASDPKRAEHRLPDPVQYLIASTHIFLVKLRLLVGYILSSSNRWLDCCITFSYPTDCVTVSYNWISMAECSSR